MIEFTVEGLPKGQPRPRAYARRMGNKYVARVYDSDVADDWKDCIDAVLKRNFAGRAPSLERMVVAMHFRMPRPQSHLNSTGKLRTAAPTHHTSKPDIDNLIKCVLDRITQSELIWKDDSQVDKLVAQKVYSCDGKPGVVVTIYGQEDFNELA
jgi:Holliday junction resolvase RusA-like endonuclease